MGWFSKNKAEHLPATQTQKKARDPKWEAEWWRHFGKPTFMSDEEYRKLCGK